MKQYSAIKEMFYGNRGNHESMILSKEERKVSNEAGELENELLNELKKTPDLLALYDRLRDRELETCALNLESAYVEGFRFGFLMALDVLEFERN